MQKGSGDIMSAPISIEGEYYYITNPVILEMFYSRMHHVQLIPRKPADKFITLDDSDFAGGKWTIEAKPFEYLWRYNPEFHNIPHLYSMETGISCCGKENIRNIPSEDMFPNYGYINKCKLCLRTKIGRVIK